MNPESTTALATVGETASAAVAAQAKALVEARFVIALKYPRDLDQTRAALLKECKRPGFADVARYNKPIGNGIVGPSIRFAEAAIRCMRNVQPSQMTVFDDREHRIVRVSVADSESNVEYSKDITIDKTVERHNVKQGDVVIRQRLNSQNQTVYVVEATEDQLLNKEGALVSKAIRTLALRLVPGDIIDECMDQVVATQRDRDAKDPDAAKRILFDSFGSVGVTVEQIKRYLGHDGATLTPKELTDLRALYATIRDGETTMRDALDNKEPATAPTGETAGAKGFVASTKPKREPKKEPAPGAGQGAPAATQNTRAGSKPASGADQKDAAGSGTAGLTAPASATLPVPEANATVVDDIPGVEEVKPVKPPVSKAAELPKVEVSREDLIEKLKNSLLDHAVTPEKLFLYASKIKCVPEGTKTLWDLSTETLSKLSMAVSALSTKG